MELFKEMLIANPT